MEVKLIIEGELPDKIANAIEREFGFEVWHDHTDEDTNESEYWIGTSTEEIEDLENDFFPINECIRLCGFVHGLNVGLSAWIAGWGGWAMGMLSRDDFSGYACDVSEFERDSKIWHEGFSLGASNNEINRERK